VPESDPPSEHMRPFAGVNLQPGLGGGADGVVQVHLVAGLAHVPSPLQVLLATVGGHLSSAVQASCCSLMYALMDARTFALINESLMTSDMGAKSHSSGTVFPGPTDAFHAAMASLLTVQFTTGNALVLPPQC